jgi:hypothetical protein
MFLSQKAEQLRMALKPVTGANSIADSVHARAWAAGRLGTQQKWVRAISQQIARIKASRPREMDVDASTQKFSVKAPEKNAAASDVARQGPLLMQPEPIALEVDGELGPDIEDIACDLVVVGEGAVEALVVLWKEGRVDLCLEVEKIEALWESYVSSRPLVYVLRRNRLITRGLHRPLKPSRTPFWSTNPSLYPCSPHFPHHPPHTLTLRTPNLSSSAIRSIPA